MMMVFLSIQEQLGEDYNMLDKKFHEKALSQFTQHNKRLLLKKNVRAFFESRYICPVVMVK